MIIHPYTSRVLNTAKANLIRYWVGNEASGSSQKDWTGNDNGTINGSPSLRNAKALDGNRLPLFADGDYIDVASNFDTDWSPSEGTFMLHLKAQNSSSWTDGNAQMFWFAGSDSLGAYISSANTIRFRHGGVPDYIQVGSVTTLNWIICFVTWSNSGNASEVWFNGVSQGTNGFSTLGGTFNDCKIGASGNSFAGWMGHGALWTTVLSDAQIKTLSKI